MNFGKWTLPAEDAQLMKALKKHGKDRAAVAAADSQPDEISVRSWKAEEDAKL